MSDKALIDQRVESFKHRAEEVGLKHGIEYEMEPCKEHGEFVIKVIRDDGHHMVRTFYTLMGLATHFEDRSWAADRSWVFIVKSQFGLRFTDTPTDS